MPKSYFLTRLESGGLCPRFRVGEIVSVAPMKGVNNDFKAQPCIIVGSVLFDDSPDGSVYLVYEVFLEEHWGRNFDRNLFVSVIDEQLEVLWPQDRK